jgi:hypothetical protein
LGACHWSALIAYQPDFSLTAAPEALARRATERGSSARSQTGRQLKQPTSHAILIDHMTANRLRARSQIDRYLSDIVVISPFSSRRLFGESIFYGHFFCATVYSPVTTGRQVRFCHARET